jgi:hypothetical protein
MKKFILFALVHGTFIFAMEKDKPAQKPQEDQAKASVPASSRKLSKTERFARTAQKYGFTGVAKTVAKRGPQCPTNLMFRAGLEKDEQKKRRLEERGAKSPVPSASAKLLAKKNFARCLAEAKQEWETAYKLKGTADGLAFSKTSDEHLAKAFAYYREKHRFAEDRSELPAAALERLVTRKLNKELSLWHTARAFSEWTNAVRPTPLQQANFLKEALSFYEVFLTAMHPEWPVEKLKAEVAIKLNQTLFDWSFERAKSEWTSSLKSQNKAELLTWERALISEAVLFHKMLESFKSPDLKPEELKRVRDLKEAHILYRWHMDLLTQKLLTLQADESVKFKEFLVSDAFDELFADLSEYYKRFVSAENPDVPEDQIDLAVAEDIEELKTNILEKGSL